MNRLGTNFFAGIGLLLVSSIAWSADSRSTRPALDQASQQQIAERVAQMVYLTPLLPAAAIQDQIDGVIADPDLSEAARDKVLYDYAYQLRALEPDPVALTSLQNLAAYQAAVRVDHPESRGSRQIPLYDVARAAKGTINQWLRASARTRAALELQQGHFTFLQELDQSAHYQQIAGTADAVRIAPFSAVASLRQPLTNLLARSRKFTPIVLAAAYRLQDEDLLRLAIWSGEGVANTISNLTDYIAVDQAAEILYQLASDKDPRKAGLAIAALGRNAHSIGGVADFLIGKIGDPELGSAAALALARMPGSEVLDHLANVLKRSPDSISQGRAALALKLNGSDRAQAMLHQLVRDKPGSSLSREVQQWLQ